MNSMEDFQRDPYQPFLLSVSRFSVWCHIAEDPTPFNFCFLPKQKLEWGSKSRPKMERIWAFGYIGYSKSEQLGSLFLVRFINS